MARRKRVRPGDIDELIARIQIAAKVRRVKPETVCQQLFANRNMLRTLETIKRRMVMRRAKIDLYIEKHGGEASPETEGSDAGDGGPT